jgi:hypothetical protein
MKVTGEFPSVDNQDPDVKPIEPESCEAPAAGLVVGATGKAVSSVEVS